MDFPREKEDLTDSRITRGAHVSGIVLAGGASSRMGRDKLRLEVGGTPLLGRVVATLSGFCDEILVVGEAGEMPASGRARRVRDLRPDKQGPLAGLEAGMREVSGGNVFLAAGDLPFLNRDLARHLLEVVARGADAALPRHDGRVHPVCAAYSPEAGKRATDALDAGERSMRSLLERLIRVEYVDDLFPFGDPETFLMNVNSPEDLRRAREVAAGG